MNRKTILLTVGAVVFARMAFAVGGMSDAAYVQFVKDTSSFWNTATNRTMSLPVDFPPGATKATLAVEGRTYRDEYADIVDSSVAVTLPAAGNPSEEDVYELTLFFDDPAKTVRTARLGLIQGLMPGGEGCSRCLFVPNSRRWSKVRGACVLPVPYGSTLTVAGEKVVAGEKGFTGAQGWFALRSLAVGETVKLILTDGDVENEVDLLGAGGGMSIIFR